MNVYWEHFKTITKHKAYVMKSCWKVGLYWQGITHDLSKYSIAEFALSARHFQGDKSPIAAEKAKKGFSYAWQHHKGRNKHHWEYWLDTKNGELYTIDMPVKYIQEMICDWIGAGKAYTHDKWHIAVLHAWWYDKQHKVALSQKTRAAVEYCMAAETEEELYWRIKNLKWDEI